MACYDASRWSGQTYYTRFHHTFLLFILCYQLLVFSLMIAYLDRIDQPPFHKSLQSPFLHIKSMSLNQEIILLQQKYQQLPRAASIHQKRALIDEIRVIGSRVQALAIAEQNRVKLRQLKGVLAVVDQVQSRLNQPSSIDSSDQHRASVQMAVDMLVHKSVEMQALDESPQKKAEIRRRIVAAVEVMRDVNEMVREQGGNLVRIQENIDVALGNAEIAGSNVQDMAQRTRRGRLRRLRASIMGVLAGLGYYILGLPGLAIGVISGWLF